jgi:NTE family protein
MRSQYPFKNLVFQGGGVKTFAYHGVLDVLERQGVLSQIQRVAGTSAGATLATLLSFRLSAAETIAIFETLDFSQISVMKPPSYLSRTLPGFLEHGVDRVLRNVDSVSRLFSNYGWYSTDYGYHWMQEAIAAHCDGNGMATFADFKARGFRDLYIVATNITTRTGEVFSAGTTPHVAVADALRMSQAIPLWFESLRFDGAHLGEGDVYADGGILNNFPMFIFDQPEFGINNRLYITGGNWETLGCRLYTPKDCPVSKRPIDNVIDYVQNLLDAMLEAQVVAFENNKLDQQRTINVSDCCVQTIDFDFLPVASNPKYKELYESGYTAALTYLRDYQAPSTQIRHWARYYFFGW